MLNVIPKDSGNGLKLYLAQFQNILAQHLGVLPGPTFGAWSETSFKNEETISKYNKQKAKSLKIQLSITPKDIEHSIYLE